MIDYADPAVIETMAINDEFMARGMEHTAIPTRDHGIVLSAFGAISDRMPLDRATSSRQQLLDAGFQSEIIPIGDKYLVSVRMADMSTTAAETIDADLQRASAIIDARLKNHGCDQQHADAARASLRATWAAGISVSSWVRRAFISG